MGDFDEESQAHAGLSSYSIDDDGLDGALTRLDDRMGITGQYLDKSGKSIPMYVAIYQGSNAGVGPEGEPLVRPRSLVMQVRTTAAANATAMIAKIRIALKRRGFVIEADGDNDPSNGLLCDAKGRT